jgi:hypothetical protein
VYEALGRGFTLLAFDVEDTAINAFTEAACARAVPLTVVRDSFRDRRAGYEARLVLVRPDQYVVWTGDGAPSDARALLGKVTGRG